jgi:hypothetical protein
LVTLKKALFLYVGPVAANGGCDETSHSRKKYKNSGNQVNLMLRLNQFKTLALVVGLSVGLSTAAKADYIYTYDGDIVYSLGELSFSQFAAAGSLEGTLTAINFNYSVIGASNAKIGGIMISGINGALSFGGGSAGAGTLEYFPSTVPDAGPVNYTFDVSALNIDASQTAFWAVTAKGATYTGTITLVGLSDPSAPPSTVPDGGSTLALMGLGMLGLGALRRRKA